MSRFTGTYTGDWKEIARAVKEAAGWRCVRCDHPHDPAAGRTLTVHHLTGEKDRNDWWNLLPLCQACHLTIQGRVDVRRPWVLLPHTPWFRPYVAGWYAWRYLGESLTREEVEARMNELLALEPAIVLGS